MNETPHDPPPFRRPHGAGAGWIRTAGYLGGVAGIVLLFLWPYVTLFPFVGSFPSEDVREALPGTYFLETLCLTERGGGGSAPAAPMLRLEEGLAPVPGGVLEKSSSLYHSQRSGTILALDAIEEVDAGKLWMLETQRSIPRKEAVASFLAEAGRYYSRCEFPCIDRGIAEGYWAAKGASVLHHWVHLYEGALGGSTHAQYGYALPWAVHRILDRSGSLGPTSFVRLSWIVFAACGLAYFAILLHLFRRHPWLALAGLLLKVHFFARIGAFALLLAPGFHWYRELVLVAVIAILQAVVTTWSADGTRRRWARLVAAGVALAVCFLVEPTFFVVAVLCALVAVSWGSYQAIADYLQANRRRFLGLLVILAVAVVAFVGLQASNLAYIVQKLRGDDLVVAAPKYAWRTFAVCAAALGFLVILRGRPRTVLHGYFALVALFGSLYFLVTPDVFHFYKFAEYAVPFGVAAAGFGVDRYGDWVRARMGSHARWISGAVALGFVAVAAFTPAHLRQTPAEWERRVKDSFGAPYFKAGSFIINGRLIRANMSERLAEHLRAFPASTRFDFMLSPFDKYVTFLYDRINGFSAPDLIAWLDSSRKLETARRLTAGSDRPVRVLLDEATLDVDPRLAIQSTHPVLGQLHLGSKLNLKARLRASELAAELIARCTVEENAGAKGWRLLRCGPER